jgi:hypothetical protein
MERIKRNEAQGALEVAVDTKATLAIQLERCVFQSVSDLTFKLGTCHSRIAFMNHPSATIIFYAQVDVHACGRKSNHRRLPVNPFDADESQSTA